MIRFLLFVLLIFVPLVPVAGQSSVPDPAVEALAEELALQDDIPGVVAAIAKVGQPIRMGAAGIRKFGEPTPITINDQLHLGSCTKAITATLIARLVERGELSWDTTIIEGLPNLKKKIHPDFHNVTIKQLLNHTSGVPANGPWHLQLRKPINKKREAIIVKCLEQPPESKPGEKYLYSNVGYMIAGVIAAKKKRTTWEKLMKKEVFEPLQLKSAGFGPPGTKGKVDQPWGHHIQQGNKLHPIQGDNAPTLGPAGTVHMTISDWAKFALAHTSKQDTEFLKYKSIEKLHDPNPKSKYALGWIVAKRSWAKGIALNHSGSNTMWLAMVWVAPETQTAYLVVANAVGEKTAQQLDGMIGKLIKLDQSG